MVRKLLIYLLASASSSGAAQDAAGEDGEPEIVSPRADSTITVLANGVTQDVDSTGQRISVFDRGEIQDVQGPDLMRLLERAPGVTFSRNGGAGSFTGVRVRGAEGEQLLVLIDGVRVADVAAPGGGFDFGNLLMGNLVKVELQRSSNSTIWGSQALGGVLAATTGGQWDLTGSLEAGSHATVYGTGGANFALGPAEVGLQAAHYHSDGFSSAAAGTEADGFRQTELAGRARAGIVGDLAAFVTARYADGRLETDGFPAPTYTLADTAEHQDTRQVSGAAGLEYATPEVVLRGTYSLADTERDNFDPAFGTAPSYTTDGTSERAELRGRWALDSGLAVDFGGEREWQRFSTLFDPVRTTASSGGYAQLDFDRYDVHFAAGVRRDEHRDFGGAWSFGADAAWTLGHVELTASYGEGFKAPTLFQLHSDFGNAALGPETSQSFDAGIAARFGWSEIELTAFRRDTEGMIGFVSCFAMTTGICAGHPFGTYDNIGRARAQGLEVAGTVHVASALTIGGAFTLLDAEDRTPGSATYGNDLARRPEHALTVTGDWRVRTEIRLGADLWVVSHSFDDAANLVPLAGYATLAVRGEWDANDRVALFARVENLWDEDYQTAAGYATEGRAVHVGASARF
jgi:vitamin B12 transporter